MVKRVNLNLIGLNCTNKLTVTVQIQEEDKYHPSHFKVELDPPDRLLELYEKWSEGFRKATESRTIPQQTTRSSPTPDNQEITIVNVSRPTNLSSLAAELTNQLNTWLLPLTNNKEIATTFNGTDEDGTDEVSVIIQLEDDNLRFLPWQAWSKVSESQSVEIALSKSEYLSCEKEIYSGGKVRILAIFGDDTNINTDIDAEILDRLTNADIKILTKPTKNDLIDALTNSLGWHILFFAGHSSSKENWRTGSFQLNQNKYISIDSLGDSLKVAIDNGLQLAIFNSCDGLGLANRLAEYVIPQSIVMRQNLPDEAAPIFLKEFLDKYSSNGSLYQAVRLARGKLHESYNERYPGIDWLPVILQHPNVVPPTWKELSKNGFIVPYPNQDEFTGRKDEIAKLKELLIRDQPNSSNIAVIIGMPGVGKSALACQFATQYRNQFPGGVYGVRVNENSSLKSLADWFVENASNRNNRNKSYGEYTEPEKIMNDLFGDRQALLIFDNADLDPDKTVNQKYINELYRIFPSEKCAIIVTTQHKNLVAGGSWNISKERTIELSPLTEPDAFAYLKKLVATDPKRVKEISTNHENIVNQILQYVGYLPVAIRAIAPTLISPVYQSKSLQDYHDALLVATRAYLEANSSLPSIWSSFALNLSVQDPETISFFTSLAVCAKSGFAESIALEVTNSCQHIAALHLSKLCQASLLDIIESEPETRYIMHSLVHEFANDVLTKKFVHPQLPDLSALNYENLKNRHASFFVEYTKNQSFFVEYTKEQDLSDKNVLEYLYRNYDDLVLAIKWLGKEKNFSHESYEFITSTLLETFFIQYRRTDELFNFALTYREVADKKLIEPYKIVRLNCRFLAFCRGRGNRMSPKNINPAKKAISDNINKIEDPNLQKLARILYHKAEADLASRDYDLPNSEKNIEECLKLLEEIEKECGPENLTDEQKHRQATVYRSYGRILQDKGKRSLKSQKSDEATRHFCQARNYFEKAKNIFEGLNEPNGLAYSQGQLGEVLLLLADLDQSQNENYLSQAINSLEQSKDLNFQMGYLHSLSIVLKNLGKAYIKSNKSDLAEAILVDSYSKDEFLANGKRAARSSAITALLQLFIDLDEGEKIINLSTTKNIDFSFFLNELGKNELEAKKQNINFDKAVSIFNVSIKIAREFENNKGLVIALNGLASCYSIKGQYGEALEKINEAIEIDINLNNKRSLVQTYNNYLNIYEKKGNCLSERIDILKNISILNEELNDPDRLAVTHTHLGKLYGEDNHPDEAIKNLIISINLIQKHQLDRNQLRISVNTLISVLKGNTLEGKVIAVDNDSIKKCVENRSLVCFKPGIVSFVLDNLPVEIKFMLKGNKDILSLQSNVDVQLTIYYNSDKEIVEALLAKQPVGSS